MRLLIDENVPRSVASLFRERGHDVELVTKELFPSATDDAVAAFGSLRHAIVVTFDRDFKEIIKVIPDGSKTKFRKASRLLLRCNEPNARRRIDELLPYVELAASRATSKGARMIMEILESRFSIVE